MRRSRGFALGLALFLLVTLASIGAYLLTISAGQQEATAQDEQAARAYQAARSGIDWGAFRVLRNGICPGATTLPMPSGFSAVVQCTQLGVEREGAVDVTVYRLTSTGCNSTPCGTLTPGYVERQLELLLSR